MTSSMMLNWKGGEGVRGGRLEEEARPQSLVGRTLPSAATRWEGPPTLKSSAQ